MLVITFTKISIANSFIPHLQCLWIIQLIRFEKINVGCYRSICYDIFRFILIFVRLQICFSRMPNIIALVPVFCFLPLSLQEPPYVFLLDKTSEMNKLKKVWYLESYCRHSVSNTKSICQSPNKHSLFGRFSRPWNTFISF